MKLHRSAILRKKKKEKDSDVCSWTNLVQLEGTQLQHRTFTLLTTQGIFRSSQKYLHSFLSCGLFLALSFLSDQSHIWGSPVKPWLLSKHMKRQFLISQACSLWWSKKTQKKKCYHQFCRFSREVLENQEFYPITQCMCSHEGMTSL